MKDPVDEPWTAADDATEEAREIRRKISARFDDDPVKLVEYYMELDKQYQHRLVDLRSDGSRINSAA